MGDGGWGAPMPPPAPASQSPHPTGHSYNFGILYKANVRFCRLFVAYIGDNGSCRAVEIAGQWGCMGKVCAGCGKEFDAKRKTARFCSPTCRSKFQRGVSTPVSDAVSDAVAGSDAVSDARVPDRAFVPNWTKYYKTKEEAIAGIVRNLEKDNAKI